MRKALYKQRMAVPPRTRIIPRFGTVPLLALILAFMAIHIHLAARVPVTLLELPVLGLTGEPVKTLSVTLAGLGQLVFQGTLGARLPFVLLAALTSVLTFRATKSIASDPIAPALAVVWLNTMLVFGVGSFLATNEALIAFAVMMILAGMVQRNSDSPGAGWGLAFLGVAILSATQPEMLWAYLAVAAALMIRPRGRAQLVRLGGLATTTLAVFALALSGLPEFRYAVPSGEMLLILAIASLVSMGPGVLTFVGVGFTLFGPKAPKSRRRTGPLLTLMVAIVMIVATFVVPVTSLAALAGPAAVLAAVTVADVRRFSLNWIGEVTTPFAFLTFILVAYLAANPGNSIFQRVPSLAEPFGWDRVAAELAPHLEVTDPKWIATEDDRLAARIGAMTMLSTVPFERLRRPEICSGMGLLITNSVGAEMVLGQFLMFQHLGDLSRGSPGREQERMRVFALGEPARSYGCG